MDFFVFVFHLMEGFKDYAYNEDQHNDDTNDVDDRDDGGGVCAVSNTHLGFSYRFQHPLTSTQTRIHVDGM